MVLVTFTKESGFVDKKRERARLRYSKFPRGTEGDECWHHWALHSQFCQVRREITTQPIMIEGKQTCMAITSPSSHEFLSSTALSGSRWGTQKTAKRKILLFQKTHFVYRHRAMSCNAALLLLFLTVTNYKPFLCDWFLELRLVLSMFLETASLEAGWPLDPLPTTASVSDSNQWLGNTALGKKNIILKWIYWTQTKAALISRVIQLPFFFPPPYFKIRLLFAGFFFFSTSIA